MFQPGESYTAIELEQITGASRETISNELCVLFNAGYLEKVKNETGRKGRMIYSLRNGIEINEDLEISVPVFVKPKPPQQTWFSSII